ncbi:MAG: hypothetical protein IJG23_02295 [Clostridia bacterium]|nr:hypothetical protein [Clostridia bacterium]
MKEKKKCLVVFIIAAIVLCGALAVGGFLMFGSQKETVNSFERIFLSLQGMRISEEYEIICNGEQSEVSRYQMFYTDGEEERRLTGSAGVSTASVVAKLNECNVIKWDGFHGKHPKNVLDGTMFQFEATINGSRTVTADGSQNFPKHYHEFETWLTALPQSVEE